MTFESIPDGFSVYLDANIFVYAFTKRSKECMELIERCREEELFGLLTTHTVAEICHATMGIEAAGEEQGDRKVSAEFLKDHPEIVSKLTRYAAFVEELLQHGNLDIIEISRDDLLGSLRIRSQWGLLTNDSLTLHIVKEWGINAIATHDDDFDRVEGIQVFKPSDV